MKLGVVSDTHDNLETAEKAADFLEERVEKVVHCGDIVAPFTAEVFDRDFDFYAVRGNNDGEWNLKGTVEQFGEFFNNVAELELGSSSIAVYHGTEEELADALVNSGNYDYLLRGHTHQKKLSENGNTIEVNPGGIPIPGAEEELHVAVIDLSTGDIEFHEVA